MAVTFTDDDLKKLKENLSGHFIPIQYDKTEALIARLEKAESERDDLADRVAELLKEREVVKARLIAEGNKW